MDAAEGDFEDVAGGFVGYGGVFLGGLGEGVAVGYGLDAFEFWVEGVDGGFGAGGGFDVGFGGDEVGEGIDGGDDGGGGVA